MNNRNQIWLRIRAQNLKARIAKREMRVREREREKRELEREREKARAPDLQVSSPEQK